MSFLANFYWIVLPFLPFDLVLQFLIFSVKSPALQGIGLKGAIHGRKESLKEGFGKD